MTSYRKISEFDEKNEYENFKRKKIDNLMCPPSKPQNEYFDCTKYFNITRKERRIQRLNSELLLSIENGNVEHFNYWLNEGANINAKCREGGFTTCHIAVLFDKCDLLIDILDKGANFTASAWAFSYLPVHLAAWKGCLKCLKTLIERNPKSISDQTNDINENYENDDVTHLLDSWVHEHHAVTDKIPNPNIAPGSTPLHIASKQLHIECVQYLLNNNPDLHILDSNNMTALDLVNENIAQMKIERFRDYAVYNRLKKFNKFPSKDSLGSGILESFTNSMLSVNTTETENFNKVIKIILMLIDAGANLAICDQSQQNCTTLLHTAVITQNEALLKILLKKRLDLTVRNELGDTPLHLAVRNQSRSCLIILLSATDSQQTLEIKDFEDKTPLQIAISIGWTYGVCVLLESGADLSIITNEGNSVLHLATKIKKTCVMAQLLTFPEMIQIMDSKNLNEETPIMAAVINGNIHCVKELLNFGVCRRITGKNNRTLVHAAAEKGHLEILQLILSDDQALINAKTDDGETALHLAASEGHLKCVQLLLQKGCSLTSQSMKLIGTKRVYSGSSVAENYDFGGTPLHCAAWKGRLSVVKYLIEQNRSLVNEPNINGWYPLHIAAYFNHPECVEAIIRGGGILSKKVVYFDGYYRTAIDIITISFTNPVSFFQHIFDSYAEINDLPLNRPESLVTFNFSGLVPDDDNKKQLKILNALLNNDNENLKTTLLLHPLIETFLHLKWKKLRIFFFFLTFLYIVFTASLTSFALLVRNGRMENLEAISVFIMLSTLVLLSLQEILHASKFQRYYITDLESWIKWSTFLTAFIVSIGGINSMFNEYADTRWKSILAIPVLLSWTEISFILLRFPVWGFYGMMFFRVTFNVIKVFCTCSSLILGFVFSFHILFKHNEAEFYSIPETFVKVIAMMSEFNYSETFQAPSDITETEAPLYWIVSRLIFLLFAFLIAIGLMNLMIGLAVSDITILEAQGKSQRLAKQIDFLNLLETFVYNDNILKWLPIRLRNHVKKNRMVSKTISFYPGNPYGSEFIKLPFELKRTIMTFLMEKKNFTGLFKIKDKKCEEKNFSDRLLIIAEELDAIKRDYYDMQS